MTEQNKTTWKNRMQQAGRSAAAWTKRTGGALVRWWKLGDGYQQKARGWAVSGFVFSLLNLFALGVVPPLSYLAVVCCVVALCKHNRALISVLGIVLGCAGILLSWKLHGMVQWYATDAAALKALLESVLGG